MHRESLAAQRDELPESAVHTVVVDLVEQMSTFAKRHPWEVARAEFCLRLLRQRGLLESGQDWLDVGAGDAWFARQLRRRPVKSVSSGIGDWQAGTAATKAVTRALITDAKLSLLLSGRGLSLPGLSYWALCSAKTNR